MTDRDALLAAVRDHPAEDTPRLVYADWLEENGQRERAHLIRYECGGPDWMTPDEEFAALMLDPRELIDLPPGFALYEFRRGFPSWVACSLANWRRHGPGLVRREYIGNVRIKGVASWRYPPSNPQRYEWRRGRRWATPRTHENQTHLPGAVFDLLPARKGKATRVVYRNGTDADLDLSAALLRWALSQKPRQPLAQPA